jgi:ribosomal protein L12E/L44/L45/RPP1/RPP2
MNMSNYSDYQDGYQASVRQANRIKSVSKMTSDELDDVLQSTEYCASGVPIGQAAADDKALRNAAEAELAKRQGME